jgi:asparagine synthase (glutamine-hydrolysing)
MCGIVGAFKPGTAGSGSDIVARMRDRMAHRGPDGHGIWCARDQSCTFGHRRLSIIDLSTDANQPMVNDAGTVALIFNGEIYNHADIRKELEALGKYRWRTDHSDTEMLLHAYEEWGLDCVNRFYGMFALAIYDSRDPGRPVVHLVRDRVGIKPLYVTKTRAGEWLFASEIRALLAHPEITPELDRTAFWHYLTFIVSPAPLTMFRGIFKIPAGYRVTIDARGASASQWWDCRPDASRLLTEKELSEPEAVAELTRLLKQSIARRMVSDVPFGVLLSGGVDSSLNVALMSELMSRPVTTFTIGYEGKEDYNEFQFARRIAARYKTDHHETLINGEEAQNFLPLLVRLQDEPIADNVCIPLYFLSKLVKESGTTVVQVGEGADENFLGYWWCEHYRQKYESVYRPARTGSQGWRRFLPALKARTPGLGGEDLEIQRRAEAGQELFWGGAVCWWGEKRERLTPSREPFAQAIDCPIEGLLPDSLRTLDSHAVVREYLAPLDGRLREPEVLQKIPYLEMKLRLSEHLLMRVDKLTMAHAVEARVPFLDHDVVDFATRLPPSYKLRDGVGKRILKKAAEPYIDNDLIYRRKQGFGAPMEEWFREGDFGRRSLDAFDRSELTKSGYFDNDYFRGLLNAQMNGSGGHSFQLWTVLNAVLWHASWIEGREDCF